MLRTVSGVLVPSTKHWTGMPRTLLRLATRDDRISRRSTRRGWVETRVAVRPLSASSVQRSPSVIIRCLVIFFNHRSPRRCDAHRSLSLWQTRVERIRPRALRAGQTHCDIHHGWHTEDTKRVASRNAGQGGNGSANTVQAKRRERCRPA